MKKQIQHLLYKIQVEQGVKVLYAAESGSRAWGFASNDSDYDVRFIYLRNKREYLRLTPRKDVIEVTDGDLDIVGWDLKKALLLGYKSNPQLTEWLNSPIVYANGNKFALRLLNLLERNPNLVAMYHAYRGLCKSTFYSELKGDELRIKKFFYCLRPIAACKWIKATDEIPPTEMRWLLDIHPFPPEIQAGYEQLVRLKKDSEIKTVLKSDWINMFEYIENFLTEKPFYDKIKDNPKKEDFEAFFLGELYYYA